MDKRRRRFSRGGRIYGRIHGRFSIPSWCKLTSTPYAPDGPRDMRSNTDPSLIANLTRHVDCLAGLIGPRHLGKPAAFMAAATYVERELANAGYEVDRQTYMIGAQEVANIVAEQPGERRKDEFVIVGAH